MHNLGAVGPLVEKLVARGDVRELTQTPAVPAGVPEKTEDEVKREFARWYEKWWVWGLIGVGVVGVGGTTYYFVRRGKRRR